MSAIPAWQMRTVRKHLPRMGFTLAFMAVVVLHIVGVARWDVLDRVDAFIYDARLRATMPRSLDERIVVVDIDEKSLAEQGRWPWPRGKLAALTDELFERQHVSVLGFDMVFAESEDRSVQPSGRWSDPDALFARALQHRSTVLGYYFTSDREGRTTGQLPEPVFGPDALNGLPVPFTVWDGYGANVPVLARAAASAGFFNAITDGDGLVRSVPLVAEHAGRHYESLALAVFRQWWAGSVLRPGFPSQRFSPGGYPGLENLLLQRSGVTQTVPVDHRVGMWVPYRHMGGPAGGGFRYVPATDVLSGRLAAGELQGKVVLVGATSPGLMDLRATPVGLAYPGVEVHASVLSALFDGRVLHKPDYALGYELLLGLTVGLILALGLPALGARSATLLGLGVLAGVVSLDIWLYTSHGLVLPLASVLWAWGGVFVLNLGFGYFSESQAKRHLAQLFGAYVPPALVREMVKAPDRYSMEAESRELTVMFCDMRGFTRLSENMPPAQLQSLLNHVFSRLTQVVHAHHGTIDKYMGDCIMAFWGAPVATPNHASEAVSAAWEMVQVVAEINRERRDQGWPSVSVGVGLNTGVMLVGDMGSDVRRSYTVMGDAVNIASRLEGLTRHYGVDWVVSEDTCRQAPGVVWQELDRVVVKGREKAITICTLRCGPGEQVTAEEAQELAVWGQVLQAYRAQAWTECHERLSGLLQRCPDSVLYKQFAQRLEDVSKHPPGSIWDGSTRFDTK